MNIAMFFVMLMIVAAWLCWDAFTGLMYRKPALQAVFGLVIIFFGLQAKHNAQLLGVTKLFGLQEWMPLIAELLDATFIPIGAGIIVTAALLRGQALNNREWAAAKKRLPKVLMKYKERVDRYEEYLVETAKHSDTGLENRWKGFPRQEKIMLKEIRRLEKILIDNGEEPDMGDFDPYL